MEFQVISSPLGFSARVYPKEEKELKAPGPGEFTEPARRRVR